ncbi:MAG: dockerin type I repeat-containing protein [Clostridia bacterium]|nr:dockerin type I repeat-containing protein [Clostridia bacterium]
MSKNLKSLICCILALLFVSGTVIAVFADSNSAIKGAEAVSVTEEESSDAEVTYRLGDVNFDGRITAADARLALRYSAKLETPNAEQFIVANVILDGKIEANDARLILRVSAKLAKESDFGIAA